MITAAEISTGTAPTSAQGATPDTPCAEYDAMASHWTAIDALMGGTQGMRAQGKTYLPKFAAEKEDEWQDRCNNSTLFNAYRQTVRSLSAQPFRKPVTLEVNLPELEVLEQDADRTGRDLTGFARDILVDLLLYGKSHILVDKPDTRGMEGTPTLADADRYGIRPYFVKPAVSSVIAWSGQTISGVDQLSQVRIRESRIEQSGAWGQRVVSRVRVLYPDRTDIYELALSGDQRSTWVLVDSIPQALGCIPMVTIYGNRTGFLTALPPLEDLADMNVKHWQTQSDQDSILHFARVYLLAFLGFEEKQVQVVQLGNARGIVSNNPLAKVQVVEHTGNAIKAGTDDLARKEKHMEAMGAEMLMPREGNVLATVRAIDHVEAISDLQAFCRNAETGLQEAFRLAGQWIGRQDAEAQVDIYQDFGMGLVADKSLVELRADYMARAITLRTYLLERQRYGLYSDSLDVDAEIAALQTENPFPAVVTDDESTGEGEADETDAVDEGGA